MVGKSGGQEDLLQGGQGGGGGLVDGGEDGGKLCPGGKREEVEEQTLQGGFEQRLRKEKRLNNCQI